MARVRTNDHRSTIAHSACGVRRATRERCYALARKSVHWAQVRMRNQSRGHRYEPQRAIAFEAADPNPNLRAPL